MLTLHAYRNIGGLKGALAKHAEATYDSFPTQEHQALARSLFLRLIDPGHTEQDMTRRRAKLSEFERSNSAQTKLLRETMDAFVAARLLTMNEQAGEATVEVSHEALIHEWARLIEWLREARENILLQQKISEDATEWQERRRPADRLYRGSQFKEARAWARRNTPSQTEATFLQASAKQRRFTMVSILVLALFLFSLTGGAVWYIHLLTPDPTLVTTQQDGPVGSLRWAVLNASSGSTITFASNLTGQTIVLTGDLVIPNTKQLTLKYSGLGKLRISLAKNTLLVDVRASLTLFNLSLLGGPSNPQSVLTNHGALTLLNSIVSGNTVSGIGGTMTLTNSTVSGNPAIRNPITGDGAGDGGGIDNGIGGTMTLTNSTISGNTAPSGDGGGIDNFGSTMLLTFCTLYGNRATDGGGLTTQDVSSAGLPPLVGHSTIQNSLIAGNSAATQPDVAGNLTSLGYNLIQNGSGLHLQSTDRTGSTLSALKIDPSLQLNGSKTTQTHALLAGSPAINVIPLAACHPTINGVLITMDQRGIKRPQEAKCDIGAYEYAP